MNLVHRKVCDMFWLFFVAQGVESWNFGIDGPQIPVVFLMFVAAQFVPQHIGFLFSVLRIIPVGQVS